MIRSRGFTLIESIVVIIVLGIAMVTITSFLAPQVASSADPQYQNRSVALGQSLMNQILARGFDEHSDFDGGLVRCGDAGATACSAPSELGVDGSEATPQLSMMSMTISVVGTLTLRSQRVSHRRSTRSLIS